MGHQIKKWNGAHSLQKRKLLIANLPSIVLPAFLSSSLAMIKE
jgi:hypothetical protein